jgi:hypothetical protein
MEPEECCQERIASQGSGVLLCASPFFLLRLYAESGQFLWQEPTIRRWQVAVIRLSRQLHFGDPEPVREFLDHRVRWLELLPALGDENAPPLLRTLALLLEKEERLPTPAAIARHHR